MMTHVPSMICVDAISDLLAACMFLDVIKIHIEEIGSAKLVVDPERATVNSLLPQTWRHHSLSPGLSVSIHKILSGVDPNVGVCWDFLRTGKDSWNKYENQVTTHCVRRLTPSFVWCLLNHDLVLSAMLNDL